LAHVISWDVKEENTGRKGCAKDAKKKEGLIALGIG
jgi:hypothetical protein